MSWKNRLTDFSYWFPCNYINFHLGLKASALIILSANLLINPRKFLKSLFHQKMCEICSTNFEFPYFSYFCPRNIYTIFRAPCGEINYWWNLLQSFNSGKMKFIRTGFLTIIVYALSRRPCLLLAAMYYYLLRFFHLFRTNKQT